jgi:hypothetical protein
MLYETLYYLDDDDTDVAFIRGAVERRMPHASEADLRNETIAILDVLLAVKWIEMATFKREAGQYVPWDVSPSDATAQIRRDWLDDGRRIGIADVGYILLTKRGRAGWEVVRRNYQRSTSGQADLGTADHVQASPSLSPSKAVAEELRALSRGLEAESEGSTTAGERQPGK